MLDFQVQQFGFRYGLAEGVEPHQAQPGTLMTAENVVWKKNGRAEKRFGTTQTSTSIIGGGNIAAASRLFTRGTELCLVDGTSLYAYAPTSVAWRNVGKVPNVGITSSTLVDSVGGISSAESAISSSGYRVDAWVTGAGAITGAAVYVQVTDVASGSLVLPPTVAVLPAQDCCGVRLLIIGTTAIILTLTSATNITAVTLNLTTLAFSAGTNLRTDSIAIGGSQGWDACVIGSNFVIAYTAAGTLLKLYSYNTSLVQQATGGITGEASGAHVVSIDGASGEVLYVLYSQGVANPSPIRIAIANSSTLVQTVAPVTIETPGTVTNSTQVAVCRYDATNCVAAYRLQDGFNTRVTTYQITSAASVTTSTQRGTFGTSMVSRPFMFGGACYLALTERAYASASSPADKSTVLVEVEISTRTAAYTPHRYVGCIDVLIGGDYFYAAQTGFSAPPGIATSSSTSVYLPSPFQSTAGQTVIRQGMRLVNFTLGASRPLDMWRSSVTGQEAFVSAGILSAYDGRTAFDYGFPRAPAFYALTLAAGGAFVAGTYLYGSLLEYRSATGMLYRSPTQTAGGTITATVNQKCTIDIDGYNLGNKQTITTGSGTATAIPTLHAWYRTTVGGSTYQRLTIEPTTRATYIDQLVGTVSFADTTSDASAGLASRPTLYTTGGILDDYAPPGNVTMTHHADRLWVLAGDQKTWWYSKAFQDDAGTAPGFHPNFRVVFDDTQVAMASMDDKAIFFSATGVKYMLGTGPAPNGLNSDFQTPTTIQSDVGCASARSVVATPDGVMFLSDRGLYLLDRGMGLSWIGRQVKDTLALFPTVTSAVLVAKQNQVRFTCNNSGGTAGCVLIFDYVEKQWSTFKYWVGGVYGGPITDACMWNGAYAIVSSAGVVYVETTASYLDASGSYYVPMTLETAWISGPQNSMSPSAGPLKFQSVRTFGLNGTSHTAHDLTISIGFDSNTTYQQTATFLAGSAVTTVGDLEECTVTIGTRRKCGSIRFKIVDATPTTGTIGTGQGPSFDLMALEVGNKRGLTAAPATKKG